MKCNHVLKPTLRDGAESILILSPDAYLTSNQDNSSVEAIWDIITPKNGKDIENWTRVTVRENVEKMLLQCQQLHFLQANETPLTTAEWKAKLDDLEFQDDVIHGRYIPPETLPQEACDLFKYMKRDPKVEDILFTSTYEDFKSFIKNCKENTSVSPSGRSYSHYKSLLQGNKKFLTLYELVMVSLKLLTHMMSTTQFKAQGRT